MWFNFNTGYLLVRFAKVLTTIDNVNSPLGMKKVTIGVNITLFTVVMAKILLSD